MIPTLHPGVLDDIRGATTCGWFDCFPQLADQWVQTVGPTKPLHLAGAGAMCVVSKLRHLLSMRLEERPKEEISLFIDQFSREYHAWARHRALAGGIEELAGEAYGSTMLKLAMSRRTESAAS